LYKFLERVPGVLVNRDRHEPIHSDSRLDRWVFSYRVTTT